MNCEGAKPGVMDISADGSSRNYPRRASRELVDSYQSFVAPPRNSLPRMPPRFPNKLAEMNSEGAKPGPMLGSANPRGGAILAPLGAAIPMSSSQSHPVLAAKAEVERSQMVAVLHGRPLTSTSPEGPDAHEAGYGARSHTATTISRPRPLTSTASKREGDEAEASYANSAVRTIQFGSSSNLAPSQLNKKFAPGRWGKLRVAVALSTSGVDRRRLRDEVRWPRGLPPMSREVVYQADRFDLGYVRRAATAERIYYELDKVPKLGSSHSLPAVSHAFDLAMYDITSHRYTEPPPKAEELRVFKKGKVKAKKKKAIKQWKLQQSIWQPRMTCRPHPVPRQHHGACNGAYCCSPCDQPSPCADDDHTCTKPRPVPMMTTPAPSLALCR